MYPQPAPAAATAGTAQPRAKPVPPQAATGLRSRPPNVREAIRRGMRRHWQSLTPTQRQARAARVRAALAGLAPEVWARMVLAPQQPTEIENLVAEELDRRGIVYERYGILRGRYVADFWLARYQLDVECDGAYWHGKRSQRARDEARDAWLSEQGITVIRLEEQDIYANVALAVERLGL